MNNIALKNAWSADVEKCQVWLIDANGNYY